MRKFKTILIASLVIASLYSTTGTAWARSSSLQRGTSWTDIGGSSLVGDPGGVSWELFGVGFNF